MQSCLDIAIQTLTPAVTASHLSRGKWTLARHLALVDRHLMDAVTNPRRRKIINMPPRRGKSTLISQWCPTWYLGRFPDNKVILCGHGSTFASTWGRVCRDTLDDVGPQYFGVRVSPEYRSAGDWGIAGHDGGMLCAGVGGGITGRGADLLIVDDVHKNVQEAYSETIREAIWEWFNGVALDRLSPTGSAVLVMTRWHQDDLAGRLIRENAKLPDNEKWDVISLPEVAGDNDILGRHPGEVLWPERWTPSVVEATKRSRPAYLWEALYQQNPVGHEQCEWPHAYFGEHIWSRDWPSDGFVCRVMAIDPSKGKDSRRGDYQAIVFLGLKDGMLYVDADVMRRPVGEMVERAVTMYRDCGCQRLGLEVNQFQELLSPLFNREVERRRGFPIPITGFNNTEKKELRIRRLDPYLREGKVRFRDSTGCRLLVQQLRDFPLGDHDDGPDALEMAVRTAEMFLGSEPDEYGDRLPLESIR